MPNRNIKEYHNTAYGKVVLVNTGSALHSLTPYSNLYIPPEVKNPASEREAVKPTVVRVYQSYKDNILPSEAPNQNKIQWVYTSSGVTHSYATGNTKHYTGFYITTKTKNFGDTVGTFPPVVWKNRNVITTTLAKKSVPKTDSFISKNISADQIAEILIGPDELLWSGDFVDPTWLSSSTVYAEFLASRYDSEPFSIQFAPIAFTADPGAIFTVRQRNITPNYSSVNEQFFDTNYKTNFETDIVLALNSQYANNISPPYFEGTIVFSLEPIPSIHKFTNFVLDPAQYWTDADVNVNVDFTHIELKNTLPIYNYLIEPYGKKNWVNVVGDVIRPHQYKHFYYSNLKGNNAISIPVDVNKVRVSRLKFNNDIAEPLLHRSLPLFSVKAVRYSYPVISGWYTFSNPAKSVLLDLEYSTRPGSFDVRVLFVNGLKSSPIYPLQYSWTWIFKSENYIHHHLETHDIIDSSRTGNVLVSQIPQYGPITITTGSGFLNSLGYTYLGIMGYRTTIFYETGLVYQTRINTKDSYEFDVPLGFDFVRGNGSIRSFTLPTAPPPLAPQPSWSLKGIYSTWKNCAISITGSINSEEQDYKGLILGQMFFSTATVDQRFNPSHGIGHKIKIDPISIDSFMLCHGVEIPFKFILELDYQVEWKLVDQIRLLQQLTNKSLSQIRFSETSTTPTQKAALVADYLPNQLKYRKLGIVNPVNTDYNPTDLGKISISPDTIMTQFKFEYSTPYNLFFNTKKQYGFVRTEKGGLNPVPAPQWKMAGVNRFKTQITQTLYKRRYQTCVEDTSTPNTVALVDLDFTELKRDLLPIFRFLDKKTNPRLGSEQFKVWTIDPTLFDLELEFIQDITYQVVYPNLGTYLEVVPESVSFVKYSVNELNYDEVLNTMQDPFIVRPVEHWYPFKPQIVPGAMIQSPINVPPPYLKDAIPDSIFVTELNQSALWELYSELIIKIDSKTDPTSGFTYDTLLICHDPEFKFATLVKLIFDVPLAPTTFKMVFDSVIPMPKKYKLKPIADPTDEFTLVGIKSDI